MSNVNEFCMKDNDFPPISISPTRSFSKDLLQKDENGNQTEPTVQCSTPHLEIQSRRSESNIHRSYSAVVVTGSKSSHNLKDAHDNTSSTFNKDEAVPFRKDATPVGLIQSRLSDSNIHRSYSAVVVTGSKSSQNSKDAHDNTSSTFNNDEAVPFRKDTTAMDLLSERICTYFDEITQTKNTCLKKVRIRDMLFNTLQRLFPLCGLHVVGSSLNGFGNDNSDIDFCLVISDKDVNHRTDALSVLKMVKGALSSLSIIQEQTLIEAKVPILRIKFNGKFSKITVDLNVNNVVAIKNTYLLRYYAFFDWRLRPLVTIIKEWAKRCDINDASRSTFTSYSLVLMVIHFLQVGVKDPVLPSLQQMYPQRFNGKNDIRMMDVFLPLDIIPPTINFAPNKDSTLGELLIGFFHYYAHVYNYEKNAISIRLGRPTERHEIIKNGLHWSHIFIEEPFTYLNTAHSIYDERAFDVIKLKFHEAYEILRSTFDLNKLLDIHPSSPVSTLESEFNSNLQFSD